MKKYKDLALRYKDQSHNEVFSTFRIHSDTKRFWDWPYELLASMAKKENWDFQRSEFRQEKQRFPILVNYLNYTFRRLQDQNKIKYTDDQNRACFNTGLQTEYEDDLYVTFYRNKQSTEKSLPDWTLYNFFDSYSEKLSEFRPLPDIASYYDDPTDLVFNTNYDVEFNYEHIIEENHDRLPDQLKNNRRLAVNAIKGSEDSLKQKLARNYKVAIPQWYENRIQLLLPLNLSDGPDAELALVAERDPKTSLYRVKTALPMNMAYMNARLITRPDRDWLNP